MARLRRCRACRVPPRCHRSLPAAPRACPGKRAAPCTSYETVSESYWAVTPCRTWRTRAGYDCHHAPGPSASCRSHFAVEQAGDTVCAIHCAVVAAHTLKLCAICNILQPTSTQQRGRISRTRTIQCTRVECDAAPQRRSGAATTPSWRLGVAGSRIQGTSGVPSSHQ